MAVPLVTVIAEDRTGWRFAGAFLLLLVMMLTPAGTALADDQEEAFSATVKVDATADSAAAARELARIDGQRRALAVVIDRLSGSAEGAKLSRLDDKTITDLVASFEVANERMSAVRYLADYTFHFRPSKLRRLVRVADSASAENGGGPIATQSSSNPVSAEGSRKPIVVLPVYKDAGRIVLWDDPNAWRRAWEQRSVGSGPVRLTIPLGDASDIAAIDAEKAGSGKFEALTAIAQQNGGDEAVVALATARRQDARLAAVELSVKRYRSGRLADTQGKTLDANPGESEGDILKRAVDVAAAEIESGLHNSTAQRSDRQVSLAAIFPIASLDEWLQVQKRLASVPVIRKVDLLSLSRQEAKIQIKYVGNPDQLKSSLAEIDLDLGGGDPVWRLQLSGATSLR